MIVNLLMIIMTVKVTQLTMILSPCGLFNQIWSMWEPMRRLMLMYGMQDIRLDIQC